MWELIDPIMGLCCNKNVSLALDADLVLLVIDTQNAEFFRLTFEVRRRISQIRV